MTGRGHETILVVDDDDAVRRFACRVLETRGYRVMAARDGAEAIELAGCFPHAIDLLLTDLRMPRLSGVAVASRLARQRPGLRLVYASGDPEGFDLGSDHVFLSKPFTADDLLDCIRRVLDGASVG